MDLFDQFLELPYEPRSHTRYRTNLSPFHEIPFTRKNIEAAEVLADAFEERGETRLAEKLRDVLRGLNRKSQMTYREDDWKILYVLMLRVLTSTGRQFWREFLRQAKRGLRSS
jgi:hypothetical protein